MYSIHTAPIVVCSIPDVHYAYCIYYMTSLLYVQVGTCIIPGQGVMAAARNISYKAGRYLVFFMGNVYHHLMTNHNHNSVRKKIIPFKSHQKQFLFLE